MTLTLTTSSRPRRCEGVSSPSQITVSAPVAATSSRSSWALPLPRNVAGSGFSRRCRTPSSTTLPAVSASAASSRSEFSASSAVPSVQKPASTTRSRRSRRYSTSETSSSSVDRPADAAQRLPVGEVELLAVGGAAGHAVERLPAFAGMASEDAPHRGVPRRRCARPRRCRRTEWVSPRSWGRRAPARRRAGSGKVSRSSASRLPEEHPGRRSEFPRAPPGRGPVRAPLRRVKLVQLVRARRVGCRT